MTVLGGLQVDARGHLANWMVPGRMIAGMGGAMDLVAGARRVIVAMQHAARGEPKIVPELTLPPTSVRPVTLVVTDMAVIEPTERGLVLRERAPGVTVEEILAATGAPLRVEGPVPEMRLEPHAARDVPGNAVRQGMSEAGPTRMGQAAEVAASPAPGARELMLWYTAGMRVALDMMATSLEMHRNLSDIGREVLRQVQDNAITALRRSLAADAVRARRSKPAPRISRA